MRHVQLQLHVPLGSLVLAMCAAGPTWATQASDPQPVIHACYHPVSGQLRLADDSGTCRRPELPLSWNQQGPAGPEGPEGPVGPEGPPGPMAGGPVLRVLDSQDRFVGHLGGSHTVIREIDGQWMYVPVAPAGFRMVGTPLFYWATTDCTGERYLINQFLLPLGLFQQATKVVDDTLYYPTAESENVMVRSEGPGPGPSCRPFWDPSGSPRAVNRPASFDLRQLGLTPPFRLVEQ